MPVNSCQLAIQNLIDGLPMPGGVPSLVAHITPPDPQTDASEPHAYVWPAEGSESRNPADGGTVPRNTGPATPSGNKAIVHDLDIYLVWFAAGDAQDADTSFPGMVDAVMMALRTTTGDPLVVTDPWTGFESQLIDIGERMNYKIAVNAVADQAFNRYDGLVTCSVLELIRA